MTTAERVRECEARANQYAKIAEEIDGEMWRIEEQVDAGGNAAAAIDRAVAGGSAIDVAPGDDLMSRWRVLAGRLAHALESLDNVRRQLAAARADLLVERADEKEQEAEKRMERRAELLAAVEEYEDCEFAPAVRAVGGNRTVYEKMPRTDLLFREADELRKQADEARSGVPSVLWRGRGKRTADTVDELLRSLPYGGPSRLAVRQWAREIRKTWGRDPRFHAATGFFHVYELHFQGAEIDHTASCYRPDVNRRVA